MTAGRRTRRRRGARVAAAVAGALILALVGGAAAATAIVWAEGHRGPGRDATYVALGSSFAAGPGVGTRVDESPTLCMRSADNYAREFARMRSYDLVDATCSGATIAHLVEGGQFFTPPQIDAIGPRTRLVTVTIGGNDVSYIGDLMGSACASEATQTPPIWRALSCSTSTQADLASALDALEGLMADMVAAIRERAPEALIVLVDYVSVVPPVGSCNALAAVSSADLERARSTAATLEQATAAVAESEGVELLRASALSRDHHVCADESWVSAYEFPDSPLDWGAMPYHPTAEAFRAIALELDRLVPPL